MIRRFQEGYKAREDEGFSMMLVMLVSYVQGAKGDMGVSYYNAAL
jgi:hypothetical protein